MCMVKYMELREPVDGNTGSDIPIQHPKRQKKKINSDIPNKLTLKNLNVCTNSLLKINQSPLIF